MSVFDKVCPKCLSVSAAYAPRCTCGYVFNNGSEEDRTLTLEQIAQQEVLFEEYLAARCIQAAETLKVAMRAVELHPQDVRKATELMRAQQAATTAQAELKAQRARAHSAVEAAGLDRAALLRARAATPLLAPVVDGVPRMPAGNRTAFNGLAVSLPRRARPRAGALALKRAVTRTVVGAAKTTTIVAKVATTVVGAAARRATRAVKATRARRRLARAAAAQAVPVPKSLPPAPTAVKAATPAGVSARAAAPVNATPVSVRQPAAQSVRNTVRAPAQTTPRLLPASPVATQRDTPTPRFRRMQAQKIAAAVATARGLDATSSTIRRCPLCGVQISTTATRCQCGWRVGAAKRDMPALPPLIGDGAATQPRSITVKECPQCTATLAAAALRCNCGWQVPAGAAELSPVSLTADERQALSLGLGLFSRRPTR